MPELSLVCHPRTNEQIQAYTTAPSHALLLLGSDGIGKTTLAANIASDLLSAKDITDLERNPGYKCIRPDEKNTISIETIRDLQRFLRLKTAGADAIRRVVVVEHAGYLTTEAQNAFLKILEEPPADTVLLLTADNVHSLLPTIRSRLQVMTIYVPAKADLFAYFEELYSTKAVTQAYFLSGGLPGLMTALLQDDQEHPLIQSVVLAKTILQQQTFVRLLEVEKLAKQKESALSLCSALARIAQASLDMAAEKRDDKRTYQWHRILKAVSSAHDNLLRNSNTKLTLSSLMLEL